MPHASSPGASAPRRSLRQDERAVSEVLGKVLMVAMAVVLLGGFGGLVISTVSQQTPTPPAASFTMEPEQGATSVDVRHVSGSTLTLQGTTLILTVDGAAATGGHALVGGSGPSTWAPGETLRFTVASPLAADESLLFLVADNATGKTIGTAYATVPSLTTGTAILQNTLAATLSFDKSPLTTDGVMTANATVNVESSHGLLLIDHVSVNLTPVGGPSELLLYDDGVAPDSIASDGSFRASFVVNGYVFDRLPGSELVTIHASVVDVLGKVSDTTGTLFIAEPTPSKAGPGVIYRDIGSSATIGTAGYVNLSAFSFRDITAVDMDQIELRVSDLDDASKVWSALVTFADDECGGTPSVTSIVLRRDGVAGNVTYTPAGGCFAIDADAEINVASVPTSTDANGATTTWAVTGTEATFQYAAAGIGDANEALIAFFGDVISPSPFARGLSQSNFSWEPPSAGSTSVPDAITDLAGVPGNAFVDLSWTAPGAGGLTITGYRIYQDGVPLATIGTNTTFRVNNLVNGQTYSFTVTALNAEGESLASNAVLETPRTIAGAPHSLAATPGNALVSLAWSAPASNGGSSIVDYHVYVGTATGATVWLASTGGTNTSFVVNGLVNGQTYFFNVTAQTALGQGASSAEASATPSTVPAAPTGFGATAGDGRVTLTWTPGDNGGSTLTNYHVYRGTTSGVTVLLASTGSGANTTFVDLTAQNGVTYYYNVTARNANGASPSTPEDSATPAPGTGAPTAPSALAATRGNQSASLVWSAPSSDGGSAITNYRVHVGTASGATSYLASTGGANTSFVVNGLTNGQLYYFNVTAVNANGQSASSNEASATPAGVPYPPTSLAATRGNQSASLTWSAPASNGGLPVTNYRIYRGLASGVTTYLASTGGANTSFVVNGLTNGETYYFNVTAESAAGQGSGSNEASVSPATTPNPPAALAAAPGAGSVTLTWTPADVGGSALTTYRIYMGTSSGGESLLASTGSGANTSFVVNGLANGQAYFFQVTAVNAVGESVASNEATATPAGTPSAPLSLSATKGDASVSLSWSAPASNGGSPVTNYRIYRGTSSGAASYLGATGGSNTTFVVNGLANGQVYFFNVTAENAAGQGASSNEASATPSTTPTAPQSLSATPGNTQVTLSWSAPSSNGGSAITTYNVYRGTASGAATFVGTTGGSNTSYVVAGLTNGQTYFFNVTAINANGQGPSSSEASATPATTPGAPQSLTATKGDALVTLSWSAPASNGGSPITNYRVYRGTASGATTYLASTGGANTTFVVNGLTNGQVYYFNVTAETAVGQGASSSEASATPRTTPGAPQALAATLGNQSASLSWSAPSSNGGSAITGYTIYRGTTSGGASFLASIGTNTSFVANGLTNGQAYFFNVTAVNANGQGASSNEASVTPAAIPYPPATFTATGGAGQIALSWTAPTSTGGSAITGYQIWRSTSSGGETLLTSIGTNTSYTDLTVVFGTTYYYQIKAVNAIGTSGASVERSAASTGTPASAPNNLMLYPATSRVNLAWSAPTSDGGSPVSGYRIYRSTTNSTGSMALVSTIGTNTSYSDQGLTNNVTYYYHILAVTSAGDGTPTSIKDATPRNVVTVDCANAIFTSGSGSCASMQLDDGVLADLRESGGGTKILNVTLTLNMTGVTGTQTLVIQGDPNNAPESLLVMALNVGTGAYDTIITVPSTAADTSSWTGGLAASTYWPNGILTVRLVDGEVNTSQTGWDVDYLGVIVS